MWLRRAGWFFLIWASSILVLGVVAYAIKLIIVPG